MKEWTYKLKIIDYDKDGEEKEVIRKTVGDFENEEYNKMAYSFSTSVDIEECELLNVREV
jgi:uncharacterized protein YxeA